MNPVTEKVLKIEDINVSVEDILDESPQNMQSSLKIKQIEGQKNQVKVNKKTKDQETEKVDK